MGLPKILAGGPTREARSPTFEMHMKGLEAQADGFDLDIRHEVVTDSGGARWHHDKISRVAQSRQRFLNASTSWEGWNSNDQPKEASPGYFDGLLMVDTDVIIGPGVLKRMWEVDADVVYGVYWTYSDWGGSMDEWPQVWTINPYGWDAQTGVALKAPGVNEVEVLGGGACTLIRGRGFESHYWPLFQSLQPYGSMWAGEDRTYCLGLEARGIRQVAVTGLPIHHCYTLADQTRPALERIREKVGL